MRRMRNNVVLMMLVGLVAGCVIISGCRARKPAGRKYKQTLDLEVGMSYDEAMSRLEEVGAKNFLCSYEMDIDMKKPMSWSGSIYKILPNGMSLHIVGRKQAEGEELKVTSISVCNSSSLFCCKGESWYGVSGIHLDRDKVRFAGLKGNYIIKNMPAADARTAIKRAGLKKLNAAGDWERYALAGSGGRVLVMICEGDGADETIATILVEAAKPREPDKTYKIECEMLNLAEPLRDDALWAFGDRWSWRPRNEKERKRMLECGQAR